MKNLNDLSSEPINILSLRIKKRNALVTKVISFFNELYAEDTTAYLRTLFEPSNLQTRLINNVLIFKEIDPIGYSCEREHRFLSIVNT